MRCFIFLRGLVGEGEAQDVARRDAEFVDKEREPVSQHACLAAAGAGHHPDTSFGGFGRTLLVGIKAHGKRF